MIWTFVLRLTIAALLGAIVGFDRELRAKEAGLRTHFLVALGSALFMIVSIYAFAADPRSDPGRIAAQVVTGIGFIGAGSILIHKQFVRGLTTAAGLWATAGIGLAVGGGMYAVGIAAMVLTLAGLELSTLIFKTVGIHSSLVVFSTSDEQNLRRILVHIHEQGYHLSYEATHETVGEGTLYRVTMVVKTRSRSEDTLLFQFMQSLPGLTIERLE